MHTKIESRTPYLRSGLAAFALMLAGCGMQDDSTPKVPEAPVTSGQDHSASTVDRVCGITAELLGVDRSRVTAETSLADLRADELDFVELVMEIEDQFGITIPDESTKDLMGDSDWQQGMKNLTMAKLAAVVEKQTEADSP